jgi:SdrD B-like domain
MRTTIRALLVAATAAPLIAVGTPALAAEGAVIAGVVFHDLDSDGVLDAGEPGIAGHVMYNETTGVQATSDAAGRYRFTGLTRGAGYTLVSWDHSLNVPRYAWSPQRPDGSRIHPGNGRGVVQAGDKQAHSGLVTPAVDYRTTQIILSPQKDVYEVGDVLDVVGGATFEGNAWTQFGAELTLPPGLRKLERLGGMPPYWAEDAPDKVTGWFYDRRAPGLVEFLGARVVVEAPVSAGEIRLQVWKSFFADTDADAGDDVLTRVLNP